MLKPHHCNFILLDKTPECDGRTDGRTDRRTEMVWLLQRSASNADAL